MGASLRQAREARRQGDGQAALGHLREAVAAALEGGDPGDVQISGWRLAKGAYDFGTPEQLLEALAVVLDHDQPFAHYPAALAAAEPLSRRIWDTRGYGDDILLRLWQRWSAHQRGVGDPWLEAQGAVQQAWHLACRGDLPALAAVSEPWHRLSPARFGRGPTKHPDAEATTLSLYWVQADLARITLRAATWADRADLAAPARDTLLDAMAIVERPLGRNPWEVDALCRAADRFGWSDAPWPTWQRVLDGWATTHPSHSARGGAVLDRRAKRAGAADGFLHAAELAQTAADGWEWVIDALQEACRTRPDPELAERIARLRRQTSVGVG